MTTSMLSEYDDLVAQMRRMRIPQHLAEAAARRELGIRPPNEMEQLRAEAEIAQLEDGVLEEGDRIVQALGFAIVRLSQKRRSKVTEGIPDRRYYNLRRRLFVWWEAKSITGRQRPGQREFQILCDGTGDPYVLGGLDALRTWLTEKRVATFDASGLPQPIPFTPARPPAPPASDDHGTKVST